MFHFYKALRFLCPNASSLIAQPPLASTVDSLAVQESGFWKFDLLPNAAAQRIRGHCSFDFIVIARLIRLYASGDAWFSLSDLDPFGETSQMNP